MTGDFLKYSSIYNTAWEKLIDIFEIITSEVSKTNSKVAWHSGKMTTEIFPLNAFISFNKDGDLLNGDEDAVISVTFFIEDGESLNLGSDICEGDGTYLAEGPKHKIESCTELKEAETEILKWLNKTCEFLLNNLGLLKSTLN